MTSVLALIDGSKYSQSVCDHAAWVAKRGEYKLQLLHVLGRREGMSDATNLSGSIGLGARKALLEELAELDGKKAKLVKQRGRAILDDAKKRVEDLGVTNVSAALRHGQFISTMQELESDAELLVIGKRGEASKFDMEHLGSNLERVVRSSRKPVLVASRAFQPVHRMLIAFDGGTSSMKAVEQIAANPIFFSGIECLLINAIPDDGEESPQQLNNAVALLERAGLKAEAQIRRGKPEEVIACMVVLENIDLLVMGAYGHSRIRNLIIGSTTTQMVRLCRIPVLLFR